MHLSPGVKRTGRDAYSFRLSLKAKKGHQVVKVAVFTFHLNKVCGSKSCALLGHDTSWVFFFSIRKIAYPADSDHLSGHAAHFFTTCTVSLQFCPFLFLLCSMTESLRGPLYLKWSYFDVVAAIYHYTNETLGEYSG